MYPYFNYMLTFEMTLKSCEGRKHCIVNSAVSGYDTTQITDKISLMLLKNKN